jgi:8-oxo-dGTP pyrophosphatase MutT (NUDIX family)
VPSSASAIPAISTRIEAGGMRERVIERLAGREPGRRGFGGSANPVEAAAFRQAIRGDHDLNPGLTPPSTALRPAAVLVPLIDHAHGMAVLLTQRTAHLTAHAGQISFPGGRIEESDADAVAAALRETEEEVGLPRERVSVVGRLDTYVTGTGFEITPVVGIVTAPPPPLAIDPFEVAEAFEVPLAYILDSRNHQRVERASGSDPRRRWFFVLPYEGRNIWGATAGILVNLAEVLAG